MLLTTTSKVPQWLRNDFARLPEAKTSMPVSWQFAAHTKILAILSQKLGVISSSRLAVWERKEQCVPGVAYKFGGTEGNSPLEDFTYLLAWRLLEPHEVAAGELCAGGWVWKFCIHTAQCVGCGLWAVLSRPRSARGADAHYCRTRPAATSRWTASSDAKRRASAEAAAPACEGRRRRGLRTVRWARAPRQAAHPHTRAPPRVCARQASAAT